jgi:hypothetical protein
MRGDEMGKRRRLNCGKKGGERRVRWEYIFVYINEFVLIHISVLVVSMWSGLFVMRGRGVRNEDVKAEGGDDGKGEGGV